ncbi:hypothetical protein HY213_05220 [Candidatus Peregrinibacteria bacterium]|nr:hypothetical protein [Candidatus Peregrinibacteria bacterium]
METPATISWPGLIIDVFIPWYAVEMPKTIIKHYVAYARTIASIFSFLFLLKTLFAPWKNIHDEYPENLFNFYRVADALALNCITRIIGFLFRSVTILLGLLLEIITFAFFAGFLMLWIVFPFLLVPPLQRALVSFLLR